MSWTSFSGGMMPEWAECPSGSQYRKGKAVVGTVRKLSLQMGECWAWQVNVPANILQPIEGDQPHGTVTDEVSARNIVEFVAGECGLVPRYDYANTIVDRMLDEG